MKLISHRGNLDGPITSRENEPNYIDEALVLGFDVEIDLWLINRELFLGHDLGQYKINFSWLVERKDSLWVHCKNFEAMKFMSENKPILNYFWHENDAYTLTSKGVGWVLPGKETYRNSILVLPEIVSEINLEELKFVNFNGICSDFILHFK
jgi:hypothetical protein